MSVDISIKYAELQNGLRCFYQHWIPASPPGVVIFVHGLGDHIGRYSHLVNQLVQRGLAVGMYDQRGHGRTEGRRGHVRRFSVWVEDLACFVQFTLSRLPPDTPLFLAGYSVGALVAMNYVLTHAVQVSGLITLSAALRQVVRVPAWKRRLATRLSKALPWLTVSSGVRLPDLTRQIEEVEALAEDPLFHRRISLSAGIEIERQTALMGGVPHRLHEPLLMLAGTGDRVSDPQATSWLAARAASLDKDCKIYDGMYHDLLHDTGREEVMGYIADWITARSVARGARSDQYHLASRGEEWQSESHARR